MSRRRRYILVSVGVLWIILAVAWVLAYFVAWQLGMGLLTVLLIAAWTEYMQRIIGAKY